MSLGHIEPNFSFWTTSGEFVFVAILAGWHSVVAVFVASTVLEVVRSFSSPYFPNTWQLALGIFLLLVIRFLPAGSARWRCACGQAAPNRCRAADRSERAAAEDHRPEQAFRRGRRRQRHRSARSRGERVSLIGSNGAGKTTLVNMITGYLKPDAGRDDARRARHHRLAPRAITRLGVAARSRSRSFHRLTLGEPARRLACHEEDFVWRRARSRRRMAAPMTFSTASACADIACADDRVLPGGVRKLLDIAMAVTHSPSCCCSTSRPAASRRRRSSR